MLKLDLVGLSRKEVEQAVIQQCSKCGTVLHVGIVPTDGPRYAYACVEMSTHEETLSLLREFGGEKILSAVVLKLEQA